MKIGMFLIVFGVLAACRVSGQDTSGFRNTLDSIRQIFILNPMMHGKQAKLSHQDGKLYNKIIDSYFDISVINSKAAGESSADICVRIKNLLHDFHYYTLHHQSPDIRMINVKEPEWKLLMNTMGIYNNGVLWFVFSFNPVNNKIVWLSEIVNPVNNAEGRINRRLMSDQG